MTSASRDSWNVEDKDNATDRYVSNYSPKEAENLNYQ